MNAYRIFKIVSLSLSLILISSIIINAQTQVGNDMDGEGIDDNSGWSISLSPDGNRVAIGGIYNDGNGDDSGHVRIYEWDGSAWTQLGNDIDGEAAGDRFGQAVSLSEDGSIVAIGADQDDGSGSNTGYASIYEWDGSNWIQVGDNIEGEATSDRFGHTISLSEDGSIVAIGADRNDGNGNDAGHIRIYELIDGTWTLLGADIEGEFAGDRFGYSISISADGTRVAAGSDTHSGAAGHVRIYDFDGSDWAQVGSDIDGENPSDFSGWSIDLSSNGNYIVIGAPFNDGNGDDAGHVRVYQFSDGDWTQVGSDIDGENANDVSGWSVSIAADGSRVAIGAVLNGTNSGHTRTFELDNGNWSQVDSDIDGEDIGDWFGYSVSLSSSGERVAASGIFNDGGGSDAGHVRIYDLDSPLPTELIYFRGEAIKNGNLLTWATESELNNDYFEVEYSIDGINFSSINQIDGSGNSFVRKYYEFTHYRLLNSVNYYRLKQMDYSGVFEYSEIINITSSIGDKIEIYPNPTTGILEIQGLGKEAVIQVSDYLGQFIKAVKIEGNKIDISKFPKGIYFISIIVAEEIVVTKIFKE